MLGLCVSVFSENRYVVAAVPFFINRNFLYLGDKVDGLSMLSPYQYRPTQFWFTGTPMDLFLLAFEKSGGTVSIYIYFYQRNKMEGITWLIKTKRKRQGKSLAMHV